MVGFPTNFKRLWSLVICLLPFACIEENGDYLSPPSDQVLNSITFRDTYNDAILASGKSSSSSQPMVITWSGNANPLPFHKLPQKTTITLNDNKFITEVNTLFDGGYTFTEYFEYNQSKRLTKARRVDTTLGYEYVATFYYLSSGLVDSVGLEQTITTNNVVTKRVGFFKKTPSNTYISIFPFDKKLSYSMDDAFSSGGIRTAYASSNENNKWVHSISRNLSYDGYRDQLDLRTMIRAPRSTTEIFEYQVSHFMNTDLATDRFMDPASYLDSYTEDLPNGTFASTGLGYYILLSDFIPDGALVNQIFFLLDYQRKVEQTAAIAFQITLDYTWHDQAF